jgi:N-carbamoyl-L-amino-acid hydrolase
MTNLAIDAERLWTSLMETALIGGTEKGGIRRLSLTEEDRRVRDWFRQACEEAGCSVVIDEVGSMFARRPGRNNSLPPICIGSHLDTQPTGGKFDGVLGVLAGLEVLRTLHEAGYETSAPIEVINWTNEEGSRFAPAMLASGAFAEVFDRDFVLSRKDRAGVSVKEALEQIGYAGDVPVGARTMSAMIELHIEQGPILDAEKIDIGIVTGVQGMRWYEITITGVESHAGSTPMSFRKDALVGAAKAVELVRKVGLSHAPHAVSTVGLVEVRPNSRNVIPGEVFLTVDLRHPDDAVLELMERELLSGLEEALSSLRLSVSHERVWNSPAVSFDKGLNEHVRRAAERLGFTHKEIVSGAGHDAAYIARVAPTTMIFVPCRDGISHNESEDTTYGQCASGAAVLLDAVLAIDAALEGGRADR